MLTSLKDNDGKIISYAEWRLVGKSGYEIENGEYIYLSDIWVHPSFEKTKRINRIIDEIMRIAPGAKYCYFRRGKYNDRMKIFSREQWERRRTAYEPIEIW